MVIPPRSVMSYVLSKAYWPCSTPGSLPVTVW